MAKYSITTAGLDRETLELLTIHFSQLADVLVEVNNTLTIVVGDKLAAVPEVAEAFAEWTKTVNAVIEASDRETARILAATPSPAASSVN